MEPEDIAAAIVKVLDKPTTLASVPPWGRFFSAITPMLAPQGPPLAVAQDGQRQRLPDFDPKAREAYEQRAQAAQGVVEGPDKN